MHLAHSALKPTKKSGNHQAQRHITELQLRLKAHHEVCDRYQHHITAIQQWLPNWKPSFKI